MKCRCATLGESWLSALPAFSIGNPCISTICALKLQAWHCPYLCHALPWLSIMVVHDTSSESNSAERHNLRVVIAISATRQYFNLYIAVQGLVLAIVVELVREQRSFLSPKFERRRDHSN
jgi:hypothetical protein